MSQPGAAEAITAAVAGWPGVSQAPHRFGGVGFLIGSREIGHLHGDRLLDVPFPRRIRNELVEGGLAQPHHIMPQSGWISFWIETPGDVEAAITILRRSFDLANEQLARRKARAEPRKATTA